MTVRTAPVSIDNNEHLSPLDLINDFHVRPGFFNFFGATVIPGGINFTIQSHHATSCELLFFTEQLRSLLYLFHFLIITGLVLSIL